MKYLKALLNEEEISSYPRDKEPTKPTKPVLSVSSDAESKKPRQAQQPPQLRELYCQAAEEVREDCFLIDPLWLVDRHPEMWGQIRDLDERLTTIDEAHPEYRATLACLIKCVRDARAAYERESTQASERALQ